MLGVWAFSAQFDAGGVNSKLGTGLNRTGGESRIAFAFKEISTGKKQDGAGRRTQVSAENGCMQIGVDIAEETRNSEGFVQIPSRA